MAGYHSNHGHKEELLLYHKSTRVLLLADEHVCDDLLCMGLVLHMHVCMAFVNVTGWGADNCSPSLC